MKTCSMVVGFFLVRASRDQMDVVDRKGYRTSNRR